MESLTFIQVSLDWQKKKKKAENLIHSQEKNQSVEMDPEMTEVINDRN